MRFTKLALALLLATCAWSAAAPASAASRPLPPLTPAKHDALSRALEQGRLTESQYALERARSLFTLGRVRAEFGHVAPANPHAATFILRDLLARTRFLSGSEHAEAKAILSRPDGAPTFLGEPSLGLRRGPHELLRGRRPAALLPLGRQPDEPRLAAAGGHQPGERDPRPDRRHDRGARQRVGHGDGWARLPRSPRRQRDDAERRRRAPAGHLHRRHRQHRALRLLHERRPARLRVQRPVGCLGLLRARRRLPPGASTGSARRRSSTSR